MSKSNSSKYEKYGRKWYEEHKEYHREYYREYDKNLKRNAIYLLMDHSGKILYVGKTSNLYRRIKNHVNHNSNLKLNKQIFNELKLHWEYAYADAVNSNEELLYIESYLINKFGRDNELLNEYEPYQNKFKKIDGLRRMQLEEIAEDLVFKKYNMSLIKNKLN
ncbi:MAG: GIY-YIG nuclease family protein [Bacillota bacterium]|nr:GIY-YIG nuclease family protein [Bacillota bacterium]